MKNDAMLGGEKISVPPTILFSLIGNHLDVRKAVSSDFKNPGDAIYLLGQTHQELGASELSYMMREEGRGGIGGAAPSIDAERNLAVYRALSSAMSDGLVASAHDCSEGGLAVALSECCFGANAGASVSIDGLWSDCEDLDTWGALFGESLGRIIVSIRPDDCEAFEEAMNGSSCHLMGAVVKGDAITFYRNGEDALSSSLSYLRKAWKGTLDGGAD